MKHTQILKKTNQRLAQIPAEKKAFCGSVDLIASFSHHVSSGTEKKEPTSAPSAQYLCHGNEKTLVDNEEIKL